MVSSDVDLLVEFDNTAQQSLSAFLSLKDILQKIFARPVDLVMSTAVRNPYLRAAIGRDRLIFYDALAIDRLLAEAGLLSTPYP